MTTGVIGLDTEARDAEPRGTDAIEADIARTRASLNRKLAELERRLSPSRRLAAARRTLDPSRLDPRPYPEWIAVGAIAAGTLLALAGWRRYRSVNADDDLEDLVIFESSVN